MMPLQDASTFILLDTAVKVTVLLALTALAALLARRASASSRHLLWALGLACSLFLPLFSITLPHLNAQVPVRPQPVESSVQPAASPVASPPVPAHIASSKQAHAADKSIDSMQPEVQPNTPAVDVPSIPHKSRSATKPIALSMSMHWPLTLVIIWFFGVILVLGRLLQGVAAVRRIERNSHKIVDGPLAEATAQVMSVMPASRRANVYIAEPAETVKVPITWGAGRPRIMLPAGSASWPNERVRAALLHEMAHVRRRDWAIHVMAHIVCAIYWFHPLVWLAARKMRQESETACDDLVLLAGMPAPDYARHLLDVAMAARNQKRIGAGVVAMAQTPKVEGRLRAVLAEGMSRLPATRSTIAASLFAAAIFALPLAALRLAAKTTLTPVPGADDLQLKPGFTLRYAVTVTDTKTRAQRYKDFEQMRASCQEELRQDPHIKPIPTEFYGPFSYSESLRPSMRHFTVTISSQNNRLIWQSKEGTELFSYLYDGKGTQMFSNGEAGRIEPGLSAESIQDFPFPAVGLPYIPLLKETKFVSAAKNLQTWQALSPLEGATMHAGEVVYWPAQVKALYEGNTWKILDVEMPDQEFHFSGHSQFQGQWLASNIVLNRYSTNMRAFNKHPNFKSTEDFTAWVNSNRSQTSTTAFRLLSVSPTPINVASLTEHPVPNAAVDGMTPAPDNSGWAVDEAMRLRYHLQQWGMDHRDLLIRMQHSQPNDLAIAAQVCSSLNALPFPLWQADTRPGHMWDGDPRVGHGDVEPSFSMQFPQVLTLSHLQRSQEQVDKRIRDTFKQTHDIQLAASVGTGTTKIILWTSGRITKSTAISRFAGHGKPFATTIHETEIVEGFLNE